MKIKSVSFSLESLGLLRPYSIAYKTVDNVKNVFFKVELDNGVRGIGSSNPSIYVVNETVEDVYEHLSKADFSYLEGRSIHEFEGILSETGQKFSVWPGTRAAIDIALYDAYTSYLKIPLVKYLGQKIDKMPTSITIGIKNLEETLAEADEYVGRGFRNLKVKTGKNPAEDAERIIRIYENYPGTLIRVDANQGYSVDDLNLFLKLCNNTPLELIEQPFQVKDFSLFSNDVEEKSRKYLVADESLRNASDAIQLIKSAPVCKIFNIKLMKSGGVKEALDIATIARNAGIDLMWGCNDESRVSISAALHTAFAQSNTRFIDLDGSLDLAEDRVEGGFFLQDGYMLPSGKPGLGLEWIE